MLSSDAEDLIRTGTPVRAEDFKSSVAPRLVGSPQSEQSRSVPINPAQSHESATNSATSAELSLPTTLKGFSVYLAFGAWASPRMHRFKACPGFRICLGFVAIAILFCDVEAVLTVGAHAAKELNQRNAVPSDRGER